MADKITGGKTMLPILEVNEGEKPESPYTGMFLVAFAADGSFAVRGSGTINADHAEAISKSLVIIASQIKNSSRPKDGFIH